MNKGKEVIQIPYGAEVSKKIWGNAKTGQEVLDNLLEYVFEQLVKMYGKSRASLMWYEDAVDAYVKYYIAPWIGELKKQKKAPKWLEIEVRKRPKKGSKDVDIDSVEEGKMKRRRKRRLLEFSRYRGKKRVMCDRCGEEIPEGETYHDEDGNVFCEDCCDKLLDFGAGLYTDGEGEFEERRKRVKRRWLSEEQEPDFSEYRIVFDGMVIVNDDDDVRRETENPRLALDYVKGRKGLGVKKIRRNVVMNYPVVIREVYETEFYSDEWYWIFVYDRLMIVKEGGTVDKVRNFVNKYVYPRLNRKTQSFEVGY